MRITVNQQCKTPYFRQITNQIKGMILRGEVPQGTMLPSERAMAKLCNVHRNTVIKAYHELKADGFITSAQGKGYRTVYSSESGRGRPEAINWSSLIRSEVQDMETTYDLLFSQSYRGDRISFAGDQIAPDIYSEDVIAALHEAMRQYSDENGGRVGLYHHIQPRGMEELLGQLSLFFQGKGINFSPRQIQMVADVNQAITLLGELLLQRGDTVLMEEPMSPDRYRIFQLKDVKVVPVPTDEQGIITESAESLIQKHHPKLIHVNSSYHDPSGVITSLSRRKERLDLSHRYGVTILEDDAASELYYEGEQMPSYASLDRGKSVIYLYSFDMTFLPGVPIGCVAAPRPVIEHLSKVVALQGTCLDSTSQMLLYQCLKTGIYQEMLERMRCSYREKRDLMYRLLQPLLQMGGQCRLPQGGVYLWLRLPDGAARVEELSRRARKKDVLFIPGFLFFPFGTGGEEYIRLNYSFASKEQIQRGIPRLIEAVNEI